MCKFANSSWGCENRNFWKLRACRKTTTMTPAKRNTPKATKITWVTWNNLRTMRQLRTLRSVLGTRGWYDDDDHHHYHHHPTRGAGKRPLIAQGGCNHENGDDRHLFSKSTSFLFLCSLMNRAGRPTPPLFLALCKGALQSSRQTDGLPPGCFTR